MATATPGTTAIGVVVDDDLAIRLTRAAYRDWGRNIAARANMLRAAYVKIAEMSEAGEPFVLPEIAQ